MKRFIVFLTILLAAVGTATKTYKHIIHIGHIGSHYPNNPYPKLGWDYNPTELTTVGMRQLYILGRGIKSRYLNNSISEKYNQLETSFRSIYSDRQRTTAAAYAFAAGLYHPGTGPLLSEKQAERAVPPTDFVNYTEYQKELRNASLPWFYTVVPVMTLTQTPNHAFEAARLCTRINKLVDAQVSRDDGLKSEIENNERVFREKLYPKLKEILKLDDVRSMDEALNHSDYIVSARYFSKELGTQPSEEDYKRMDELYYIAKYRKLLGDKTVAKLVVHGLLSELKPVLEAIADKSNTKAKMTSYMLEDIHILALLKLLDFNYGKEVMPFGSSFIIAVDDKDMVSIQYNDAPVQLNKKNEIPIKEFINWNSDNILNDFQNWCYGDGNLKEVSSNWIRNTFIVGGIFLAVLIVTWVLIFTCRRTKYDDTVPEEVQTE